MVEHWARGRQHPTTVIITNNRDDVRKMAKSTGPATATAVLKPEVFLGIDAVEARQVVTRFIPNEGPKPAEGMSKNTLLNRVAQLLKAGFRVHGVYEAGPTGFALARESIALGAECIVARLLRRAHDREAVG